MKDDIMRRTFTLTLSLGCCLLLGSVANGQDFFEQLGRQLGNELQNQAHRAIRGQRGGGQPSVRPAPVQGGGQIQGYGGTSLPSEGANKSGPGQGQGSVDVGNDFLLPGNSGGQPFRGQPNQGLPYQGQPYQVQPYQGQIYQAQPYRGQTYHGTVTSASSDIPTAPVESDAYIVIRCPKSSAGSIRYTLSSSRGDYAFTMSGGKEQRFRKSTNWTISYNDGTQQRRYRLEGGRTYTLKTIEGNRWQLYSVAAPGS